MFELLGDCSRFPGGKNANMIQGRSGGGTEKRIDPRDSEDIELTAFEREAEKCGFTFRHCVFGNQCNSLKSRIRFVNRFDDEFGLGHVWVELSVQYPNGFIK